MINYLFSLSIYLFYFNQHQNFWPNFFFFLNDQSNNHYRKNNYFNNLIWNKNRVARLFEHFNVKHANTILYRDPFLKKVFHIILNSTSSLLM